MVEVSSGGACRERGNEVLCGTRVAKECNVLGLKPQHYIKKYSGLKLGKPTFPIKNIKYTKQCITLNRKGVQADPGMPSCMKHQHHTNCYSYSTPPLTYLTMRVL